MYKSGPNFSQMFVQRKSRFPNAFSAKVEVQNIWNVEVMSIVSLKKSLKNCKKEWSPIRASSFSAKKVKTYQHRLLGITDFIANIVCQHVICHHRCYQCHHDLHHLHDNYSSSTIIHDIYPCHRVSNHLHDVTSDVTWSIVRPCYPSQSIPSSF